LRATTELAPVIEVLDSRIEHWDLELVDRVADLASAARVVLPSRLTTPGDFDLSLVGMMLLRSGEVMATGAGAAALGHPLRAAAWAINQLAERGIAIEPGQYVLTGGLHRAVDVRVGDTIRASFDRLGSVTVRFT
jgi:2-keto-4-pentenoate hydratase